MHPQLKTALRPLARGFLFVGERATGFSSDPVGYIPGRCRMLTRRYEPETVAAIRSLLRPGDTAIDVGANVGYLSRVMAECIGRRGQLHAIEPQPRIFRILAGNLRRFPQARLHHLGLGDRPGQLDLHHCHDGNVSSFVPGYTAQHVAQAAQFKETLAVTKVPVSTGDTLFADLGPIRLLKVDVEGFELNVFRGFAQAFTAGKIEHILFELNPKAQACAGLSDEDIFGFLRPHGFRFARLSATGEAIPLDPAAAGSVPRGGHSFLTLLASRHPSAPIATGPTPPRS